MDAKNHVAGLKTGVSDFYLVNQSLLGLISRVIVASEETDLAGLKDSLLDLQAETLAHFDREEQLMAECKYEAAAQHRAEHQQLSKAIQQEIDDLNAGKGNVSFVGRFMHHWMLQHIVGKDSLFVMAMLTQNGMTDRRRDGVSRPTPDDEADFFEERRLENLEPILWSAKIAVGVEAIDNDHRTIFALLKAIIENRKSSDRTSISALLEQLGDETATHFRYEENLMSGLLYEDAAEHKEEHRKLLDEFAQQVEEFQKSNTSAELLCRFIYRWFQHHIDVSDSSLCAAIRRQNKAG